VRRNDVTDETPVIQRCINMVERWFVEPTTEQIRRGVHLSTRALA